MLEHHADAELAGGTAGLAIATGWPCQTICPSLGSRTPNSILTSVDLPAPFSPSSAWISPGADIEIYVIAGSEAAEQLCQFLNRQ
jgi:hypothetical protein